MSKAEVQRASDMCAVAGTWLVLDNTYEDFVFGGREHFCVGGRHVINIFSFSKVGPTLVGLTNFFILMFQHNETCI